MDISFYNKKFILKVLLKKFIWTREYILSSYIRFWNQCAHFFDIIKLDDLLLISENLKFDK